MQQFPVHVELIEDVELFAAEVVGIMELLHTAEVVEIMELFAAEVVGIMELFAAEVVGIMGTFTYSRSSGNNGTITVEV